VKFGGVRIATGKVSPRAKTIQRSACGAAILLISFFFGVLPEWHFFKALLC
jgi:hypothetical protein